MERCKKNMLDFEEEITYLNQKLSLNINFDLVSRRIQIGNRKAVFYFLDGFAKSDLMHNILKELMAKKEENLPDTAVAFTEIEETVFSTTIEYFVVALLNPGVRLCPATAIFFR